MRTIDLSAALKDLHEEELAAAPRQHRLRTPVCPPVTRFPAGVKTGWTDEERAHVSQCAYCQKATGMVWNVECPGLLTLAKYLAVKSYGAGADMFQDGLAIEYHLDASPDSCHCKLALGSKTTKVIAELLVKAGTSWRALAVGTGQLLTAGSFDAAEPRVFHRRTTSTDGSLTATLWNYEGYLTVAVEASGRTNAGRTARIEIIGEKTTAPLVAEVSLADMGEGLNQCKGEHVFGPVEEYQELLGEFFWYAELI